MVIYIISPRIFRDQLILQQIRVNLNIFGGNEYNLREKKVVSMNGKSQFCEWRHRAMAARLRRAERSYSTFKVGRGGREKIALVHGKEQRLRFAGAAVKRHPTSKVRETQVRRGRCCERASESRHTKTIITEN